MPISLRLNLSGLTNTIRGLNRTKDQIGNLTPFWRTIAVPLLKDRIRNTFLQEGPGWARLAPSTLRTRKYPDLPILQQTGSLMHSVVDNPVIQSTRRQLLYGTNNPYAVYHERGTSKMPARPFLGPSRQAVIEEIRDRFIDHVRRTT